MYGTNDTGCELLFPEGGICRCLGGGSHGNDVVGGKTAIFRYDSRMFIYVQRAWT